MPIARDDAFFRQGSRHRISPPWPLIGIPNLRRVVGPSGEQQTAVGRPVQHTAGVSLVEMVPTGAVVMRMPALRVRMGQPAAKGRLIGRVTSSAWPRGKLQA